MNLRRGVLFALCATAVSAGVLWLRLKPGSASSTPTTIAEPRAVARLATWRPERPASRLGRLAAYAWAAPLTTVGLVMGALSQTRPQIRHGIVLFTNAGGLGGGMLRWRGFSAATLGHVVIASREPTEQLLRHELVHVRQAERWGPLFVPLYLAGLARYGYRRNPLERAAYREDETVA